MEAIATRNVANRSIYLGLLFTTLATLSQEILLTRIFSVTMWYHFAFMAISVAMFGMTLGAMVTYLFPRFFSDETLSRELSLFSLLFSVSIIACFFIYLCIPFRFELNVYGVISLTLIYIVITVPFILSGICVCLVLTRFPQQFGRLYATDLLGAGLGCLTVIALLNIVDAMTAIILVSFLASIAAIFFARTVTTKNILCVLSLGLFFFAVINAHENLIKIRWMKGENAPNIIYDQWNAYSRVTVIPVKSDQPFGWGISETLPSDIKARWLLMQIDGLAGTPLTYYQGDINSLSYLRYDVTNIGYYLTQNPEALIIGVGGGRDILSAKVFDAKSITGVEINHNILKADDYFKHYIGPVLTDPDVSIINTDARQFLRENQQPFDFIQISLIDTWAATAAGAYVLSENALYTMEAWQALIEHLSPQGILSVSRWYYAKNPAEIYRLTVLACESMRASGIDHPRQHLIIVANIHQNNAPLTLDGLGTLLLSKKPFSTAQVNQINAIAKQMHFKVLLTPTYSSDAIFDEITSANNSAQFIKDFPLNIAAPTDDKPFFFQLLKWRDAWRMPSLDGGLMSFNYRAVWMLNVLMFIVTGLTLVCIIFPLLLRTNRYDIWKNKSLLIYFLSIGLGFMLIEVSQMQRLIIYCGNPTYSLSVILFSLLLSTGIGSFLSQYLFRLKSLYTREILFGLLLLALIFYDLISKSVLPDLEIYSSLPRMVGIAALLFPLGLSLGFAFPIGMSFITEKNESLAAWFWGVNGAASVCASVLAMIIALNAGISIVYWSGVVCYAIPFLILLWGCLMKMHNPLFLAVAMAAKARVKEIDIHEAKKQMESNNPPLFIDVREDNEWAQGHLPQAIHLSKGIIERDIEKSVPDLNTPLILYCSGGYRSAVAADALLKMGYKNVASMESGCSAWVNAGYPFENAG